MTAKSKPSATQQSLLSVKNRCQFSTVDGRQCRMYRAKNHKSFCLVHSQHEEQMLNAEAVAAELIGPVEEYQTAISVNRTLGCLFNMVAQKRVSRQDGALLAFIGQMLLHSVGSTIKEEFLRMSGDRRPCKWEANIRRSVEILSNDYSLQPPAPPEEAVESQP
jgi:hypothetical protein